MFVGILSVGIYSAHHGDDEEHDDDDDDDKDDDEDDEHNDNNIHSKTSFAALLASRSLSATLMNE